MFTRNFKRTLSLILALLTVFTAVFTFVSCDEDENVDEPERVGEGTSDIEVGEVNYGFIEEDEYDGNTTTIADTKKDTKLYVDIVYFCLIEFDIAAKELNDGTSMVNILVRFTNLEVTEGTTEEAGTGNFQEMTFTDAGTGSSSKQTTLGYKIPSDPDKPKKIKILVRLLPVSMGESHIAVSFEAAKAGEFKVLGDGGDGFTKKLTVERDKIDAPVIEVTDMKKVKWKHVKHADKYVIHFGEKTIEFTDVEYAPGQEIEFNLFNFASLGVSFGEVKIRAYSNSNNFVPSDFSNVVTEVSLY